MQRYGAAIRLAWQRRKELESPPRLPHEAQFLPAALALQDTPVSPAPRVAMWLLITFAAFAVLWAIFGRLDVVVVAQGKTVPNERVKVIQPIETATVNAIHVTDGQIVKTGAVLVELDATAASADITRLGNDLIVAKLQSARSEAFLEGMDGKDPVLKILPGIDDDRLNEARQQLESQWREYKAKLERLEAEITRCEAEVRSIQEVVHRLERTLPIIEERADTFKDLYEREVCSKQDYLERERARIEQEGELAAQSEKLRSVQAALTEAIKQKDSLVVETRRVTLDTQREADQKVTTNTQELIKAQQRHKLMKLTAPVDGSVQQLAIHTVGGLLLPPSS